ncbi:Bgt-20972 [Blumeria graminis f. sp. tritici]|uniref:Bgt-20972 n=2 Tax=Blumeria graminis f. sp. tritici TaxID=62690 RepID=A0A9X9QF06_BLUGR|nr:Bgt-20972 [Blumeria graminis f. sp. tritici]
MKYSPRAKFNHISQYLRSWHKALIQNTLLCRIFTLKIYSYRNLNKVTDTTNFILISMNAPLIDKS